LESGEITAIYNIGRKSMLLQVSIITFSKLENENEKNA